jgi:hypothetical protein
MFKLPRELPKSWPTHIYKTPQRIEPLGSLISPTRLHRTHRWVTPDEAPASGHHTARPLDCCHVSRLNVNRWTPTVTKIKSAHCQTSPNAQVWINWRSTMWRSVDNRKVSERILAPRSHPLEGDRTHPRVRWPFGLGMCLRYFSRTLTTLVQWPASGAPQKCTWRTGVPRASAGWQTLATCACSACTGRASSVRWPRL